MNTLVIKKYLIGIVIAAAITVSVSASVLGTMEGSIYSQGSSDRNLIYTQRDSVEVFGSQTILTHEYYRDDGTQAAYERVVLDNGEIVNYQIEIFDFDMYGEITRNGSSMTILQQQGDKIKVKNQDWNENLLTGPMLPTFIGENRDLLAEGERILFHLPFFDTQTLIPFKLEKKNGQEVGDQLIVQMKLKNGLLGMLIKPIDFVIDMNTGLVLEIHGPTILPNPETSNKNDLAKAHIYYSYGTEGGESL